MKKFTRNLMVISSAIIFSLVNASIPALAATTPSLGSASSYSVLSSTYTNTTITTINGDLGFTTGPAVTPSGTHANYGSGAPYSAAGTSQGTVLASLNSQSCTFSFPAGAINLSTDITHGTAGVYAPGVYCSIGAMNIGGPLSLSGSGTDIFRTSGALTTTVGAVVSLNGASACDVFWTPTEAVTLAANTTFFGTIIDDAGITVGANTTWIGLALAFGGTVTTDTDTISSPTCSVPIVVVPPVVVPPAKGTLHIIKQVVNTGGGTASASLFNLHVKLSGSDVSGSPANGTIAPGTSYSLNADTYVVSEDANSSYTKSFSGDCDSSGSVILPSGADKTCTIINTYIVPVVTIVVQPVVKKVTAPVAEKTVTTVVVAPVPVVKLLAPKTPEIVTSSPALTAPGLPHTGGPSEKKTNPWDVIIASITLSVFALLFIKLKKQKV